MVLRASGTLGHASCLGQHFLISQAFGLAVLMLLRRTSADLLHSSLIFHLRHCPSAFESKGGLMCLLVLIVAYLYGFSLSCIPLPLHNGPKHLKPLRAPLVACLATAALDCSLVLLVVQHTCHRRLSYEGSSQSQTGPLTASTHTQPS